MTVKTLQNEQRGLSLSCRATVFLINFIVIYFVYNALLQNHFSPDVFAAYAGQYEQVYWQISLGRFVHGLVYHALLHIGLGIISHMPLYTFLFMAVSAWCADKMACGLCKAAQREDTKTFFLCDCAFLISVINICVLEWYLFPEAMVMYAIALWGAVQGALAFVDDHRTPLQQTVISFIFLFIGINSYQAILGWYIALSLMVILAKHHFILNLRAFFSGCAAMVVGGVNALLNQLIVHLAQGLGVIEGSSRQAVFASQGLAFKLRVIIDSQKDFLKNGYYLLPNYFLFIALASGVVLLLFTVRKDRFRRFFSVGIALGAGYVLTLLPHLVSDSVRITPRTLPSVFAILALLFVCCILCGGKTVRSVVCLSSILVLLISSQSMSVIIADHMTTVHTDVAEGRAILREIEAYENETMTNISEICILPDAQMQFCYPGVTTMWMDINPRHMTVEWEREPFLEILSGRDFTFITLPDHEAEAIVQGRNWQYPDYKEQIIFDRNRAYIILY